MRRSNWDLSGSSGLPLKLLWFKRRCRLHFKVGFSLVVLQRNTKSSTASWGCNRKTFLQVMVKLHVFRIRRFLSKCLAHKSYTIWLYLLRGMWYSVGFCKTCSYLVKVANRVTVHENWDLTPPLKPRLWHLTPPLKPQLRHLTPPLKLRLRHLTPPIKPRLWHQYAFSPHCSCCVSYFVEFWRICLHIKTIHAWWSFLFSSNLYNWIVLM